jgi:hypothetical protein
MAIAIMDDVHSCIPDSCASPGLPCSASCVFVFTPARPFRVSPGVAGLSLSAAHLASASELVPPSPGMQGALEAQRWTRISTATTAIAFFLG